MKMKMKQLVGPGVLFLIIALAITLSSWPGQKSYGSGPRLGRDGFLG